MERQERKIVFDGMVWFFIAFLSAATAFVAARQIAVMEHNDNQDIVHQKFEERLNALEKGVHIHQLTPEAHNPVKTKLRGQQ